MSDVQRYGTRFHHDAAEIQLTFGNDVIGEYVTYEDYKILLAENSGFKKKLAIIDRACNKYLAGNYDEAADLMMAVSSTRQGVNWSDVPEKLDPSEIPRMGMAEDDL